MNAKQAKQNKYAKDKQTGIIYPYEYVGFQHPQRYCYIRIRRSGMRQCWFAKHFDVATEAEYLKQAAQAAQKETE